MSDFNARDYVSSTFVKKADLRTGGQRRVVVKAVEEGEGLPGRNGQASRKELHLVFTDETRFSLRTQTNLRRMVAAFGDRTSQWIGQVIELYFSPDVPNPGGGEPGGIRIRIPEATTTPGVFVSELDEAPAKPNGAAKRATKRTSGAGTSPVADEDEAAF